MFLQHKDFLDADGDFLDVDEDFSSVGFSSHLVFSYSRSSSFNGHVSYRHEWIFIPNSFSQDTFRQKQCILLSHDASYPNKPDIEAFLRLWNY
jgi:hypothetical protein